MSLDFAWGNPYFLLDILDNQYIQRLVPYNMKKMSYAPDYGVKELVNTTHRMIKNTTGLEYDHIIITNGATQAINVLLRVLSSDFSNVVTAKFAFPYYDDMISKAGYDRVISKDFNSNSVSCLNLMDSPSNPFGIRYGQDHGNKDINTIWDAVYHNQIYTKGLRDVPKHFAMVGSYSKLLGVTGARIGFIATNRYSLAKKCAKECLIENATISLPSQNLIIDIMDKIDFSKFLKAGRNSLNVNKELFRKVEYLFDNQQVPETGMFYCVEADKKSREILDKCGIKYVRLGKTFIRLSLGQTNILTKTAIKTILKEDGK